MKNYNYAKFDIGSKEYHINSFLNLYFNNIFIQTLVNTTFNSSQHIYNYEYIAKSITIDGITYTTFPQSQNNGDETELAYFDNILYSVHDINSKENGNPIFVHLE